MEIRCSDLSVVVETRVTDMTPSNISSPKLPSLLNSIKDEVGKFTCAKDTKSTFILSRVSAVFEPGTLTLVLGQPGSGKSTLLKVLSGQLAMNKHVTVEGGSTSYNGLEWKNLLPKLPQLAAYVPQSDQHFSSLTVQETLEFAHACCGEPASTQLEQDLTFPAPNDHSTDVVIEQLGLKTCRDTKIGNDLSRGVSGGELRRVTTGEMGFGTKFATFMDEITTGATAFDIVYRQREITKKQQKTGVMALLQSTPEVFDLFDNILLLNNGEVICHGPRGQILSYFRILGFECPSDRNIADFFLDLATDQQQQYEVIQRGSLLFSWPRAPSEFAIRFQQSEMHQKLLLALAAPVDSDLVQVAEQWLSKVPEFHRSFWSSAWLAIRWQTRCSWPWAKHRRYRRSWRLGRFTTLRDKRFGTATLCTISQLLEGVVG